MFPFCLWIDTQFFTKISPLFIASNIVFMSTKAVLVDFGLSVQMTEEIYFPKDLRGTEVIMFIRKWAIAFFFLVFIYVWLSLGLNCGIWGLSL